MIHRMWLMRCSQERREKYLEALWNHTILTCTWCNQMCSKVSQSMCECSSLIRNIVIEFKQATHSCASLILAKKFRQMIPYRLKLFISIEWWTRIWPSVSKCMIQHIFTTLLWTRWRRRAFELFHLQAPNGMFYGRDCVNRSSWKSHQNIKKLITFHRAFKWVVRT